jgi:3-oxoadipate enol-lactonase
MDHATKTRIIEASNGSYSRSMKIKTNDIELNVRVTGAGPLTLFYLHYWGGSSRTWAGVIDALPGRWRHVAIDLRGWGDSDRPDGAYSLDEMARDVRGVIDALMPDADALPYVLVGHSMGGKLAQRLAAERPAGLLGLVLVAPSPPLPLPLDAAQRNAIAHAYDDAASVEAALEHVLTASPLAPALRQQVVEDSLRGASAAKRAWPHDTMREDIADLARAIEVPVLVLSGELDRVDPPAALLTHLLPVIPHAVLETVPRRGHLLPLEAPAAVAGAIARFVGGLAA